MSPNPICNKSSKRKRNLRVKAALLVLTSLLAVISGCSGSNAADPSTDAASGNASGQLHKMTVMLDWYPNAVHSFLYAAQEKGYFAEEGLEVVLQMPADSNDALKLAAAGKVDLALSYQPQVLMARSEEIPVVSVAALVRHPLNHLLVPADSGIKSPKELAGKTAGYSSIPLYEAMLRTMVEHDGGDPQSIAMVDVGFDLIPAITAGRVDAIIGGFINHEQLILDKENHPVTSIDPTAFGVPDYYELVLVAGEQGLQESKDYYSKFMNAARKGQQFVQDHPKEALDILLAHEDSTAPLDPQIESRSLDILLPLMDAGDQPFGYQTSESWSRVADWLSGSGLLSGGTESDEAFLNL
ncbi:ABC transporter substrate-binding protein [Paenibacillus typhae]|uniref:Putative hydroxymethylpyrimidine transport system substrate-binding protein n=1 Tax=Paenibacillus typhae TaxID=1174501 RepID=A0A1G8YB47_9BACL|nr:ABC transporter substrate-binding protein [Paenibacillus typhae]SDK00129.1 putative hydroxymethylpyrimidine transport system substrate-binding protein [Paenibacillus typhae]